MHEAKDIIGLIESKQDIQEFQELNWNGSFEEYLELVIAQPSAARTAFQRIYDMIVSHGVEELARARRARRQAPPKRSRRTLCVLP